MGVGRKGAWSERKLGAGGGVPEENEGGVPEESEGCEREGGRGQPFSTSSFWVCFGLVWFSFCSICSSRGKRLIGCTPEMLCGLWGPLPFLGPLVRGAPCSGP